MELAIIVCTVILFLAMTVLYSKTKRKENEYKKYILDLFMSSESIDANPLEVGVKIMNLPKNVRTVIMGNLSSLSGLTNAELVILNDMLKTFNSKNKR